jgi:hypothetical protein
MANTNIGVSNFVFSQTPFFVRNDHPNFVRFIEAYYEYLEQEGKTIQRAKAFREALDVDKTIDLYTEKLYSQFLSLIPEKTIADKDLIIKHVKDFYRARGTEKSIEFLLAILYDQETTFYYPKKDILKASDGKWYQEKSLKVFDLQINNTADPGIFTAKNFTGRQIRGATSNATATVESVDVYYENAVVVKELKVSNQVRDFIAGEKINAFFEEEGQIKYISANVFSGIVVRVDIKNRGNNYIIGDQAIVESVTGSGAIIVVSEVSKAAIKTISPTDGGAGFQNTNLIIVSSTQGFGANAYVSLVNADESVHPNSYNIAISLISTEANSIIGNTSANPYETFAYYNLSPVYVTSGPNTSNMIANTISGTLVGQLYFNRKIANSNVFFQTGDSLNVYNTLTSNSYVLRITSNTVNTTNIQFTPQISGNLTFERVVVLKAPYSAWSNLTISCGVGASVATINLSARKANSNVFFETFDNIFCFGTNVTIISSNSITNQLIVNPGLPGPLTNQPFQVIKKSSIQTTLANSLSFFTYANTGPIQRIIVLAGGENYTGSTTLTAEANNRVKNLGIIGKLSIVRPGSGYVVNDEIEIINRPYATFSAGTGGRGYVSSVNATGAITGVRLKQAFPGQYIGGSGYSIYELPTANIITSTGVGGNVAVVATLGEGEVLISTSDDIGAILSLTILSGGSGYKTPPVINLRANGSGTAQVESTIVEGVFTYPGRYLNDDGHLSSYNFLQDGKYYHNYSYVVKIRQAINGYRRALKDLVHPSGMSLFGEYTDIDNGQTMNVQVRTVNVTNKIVYSLARYVANVVNINISANTITSNVRIIKANNGIANGSIIYLEFQSGDTINIANGIFVTSRANGNVFTVTQTANTLISNLANTSGNVYYGIME